MHTWYVSQEGMIEDDFHEWKCRQCEYFTLHDKNLPPSRNLKVRLWFNNQMSEVTCTELVAMNIHDE